MVELHEGDLIGIGCSTDHDSINNPECIVLRVTQNIVHYSNEQSSADHRPNMSTNYNSTITRAALSAAIVNAMPIAESSLRVNELFFILNFLRSSSLIIFCFEPFFLTGPTNNARHYRADYIIAQFS